MAWKFSSDKPIYLQVSDILALDILKGVYPAGSRFPSVRDIAAAANINPNTAQRALTELESKNLIITHGTSGRIVTTDTELLNTKKEDIISSEVKSFYQKMRAMGVSKQNLIYFIKELEE